MIKALSFAAALAVATPALAVAVPQTAPAAAEVKSPEEIAFEARADAFKARMEQMQSEFGAAIGEAHGDEVRGMAAVDAVLARYQPDITSFLNDFDQFIDTQIATNTDETAHEALISAKAAVRQSLEGLPGQMRAGARTAIAAQTPAA